MTYCANSSGGFHSYTSADPQVLLHLPKAECQARPRQGYVYPKEEEGIIVIACCTHRTTASISIRNPTLCRGLTHSPVPLMACTMLQSSSTAKQLFCQAPCKNARQCKQFTVASRQRAVTCQAQQTTDVIQNRRAMAAVLTAAPLLLMAQKGDLVAFTLEMLA